MPIFNFDYDINNDDLFLYKEGSISKFNLELGNIIYDFDSNNNLVGLEILSASKTLSDLINKKISKSWLKNIIYVKVKTKTVNNLMIIRLFLSFKVNDKEEELFAPIQIPSIKSCSPASN